MCRLFLTLNLSGLMWTVPDFVTRYWGFVEMVFTKPPLFRRLWTQVQCIPFVSLVFALCGKNYTLHCCGLVWLVKNLNAFCLVLVVAYFDFQWHMQLQRDSGSILWIWQTYCVQFQTLNLADLFCTQPDFEFGRPFVDSSRLWIWQTYFGQF